LSFHGSFAAAGLARAGVRAVAGLVVDCVVIRLLAAPDRSGTIGWQQAVGNAVVPRCRPLIRVR
jgi:hypothetical protein